MEIWVGQSLFDDLLSLLIPLLINVLATGIIIRSLYYRYSQKTEYVFTYFMVSLIVFFLCFTLQEFAIDIGVALGLFAIFGIIRYRTQTIEIKEMTYLFVVIGVSVINALSKMNLIELVVVNLIIILAIYIMERYILTHNGIKGRSVIYDQLDNIKPENHEQLLQDLSTKTGLDVKNVKVDKVDYANQVATLIIYYSPKNG